MNLLHFIYGRLPNFLKNILSDIRYSAVTTRYRRRLWIWLNHYPSLKRISYTVHSAVVKSENLLTVVTAIALFSLIFDFDFAIKGKIYSILHYFVLFLTAFGWSVRIFLSRKSFDVDTLNLIVSQITARDWFKSAQQGTLRRVHMERGYEVANDENIKKLNRLNSKLFRSTQFEAPVHVIHARNTDIFNKRPDVFRLIRSRIDGISFVGFTHVMPLNHVGAVAYLDGAIKDRDFRSEYVAARGEDAKALLLFSVAHKKEYQGAAAREFSRYFWLHVLDHIADFIEAEPSLRSSDAQIILQVEGRDILSAVSRFGFEPLRITKGGIEAGAFSGDGFPIYSMPTKRFMDLLENDSSPQ